MPSQTHTHSCNHTVQFYDTEPFLAAVVSEFLTSGLEMQQPAIVIATPEHRDAFVNHLRTYDIDVESARQNGQLTMLDARETLHKFMKGSMPNAKRFKEVIGSVIEGSLLGYENKAICAYGEMVDLLWKDGNAEGAIRLEDLWNELGKVYKFSLLCAYSMENFKNVSDADQFRAICYQHTNVFPTERYTQCSEEARLLEISLLQQRSKSLETEVVRREKLQQELRETIVALQEREDDLRDVLENASEGIHMVTGDGIIQWANNAELNMLGYLPEEYIGRSITDFHVDSAIIEDILQRLSNGETLRGYEARMRHKDGSVRDVTINSNVRWRDGEFVNTRCFTRDVTESKRASSEREQLLQSERAARAEAERARMTAEQANRAKSEFLAVMSHELRTPLNAIGGYAELMEMGIHGPVSGEQRETLERIQRSQRLLLGLINQVLNYARIETGNIRYNVDNIHVHEALRTIEALFVPQLRTKGLHYSYSGCAPDLFVHADIEKLQQIVLNLLTNAVKFTDRGGKVNLEVETNDTVVMIRVRDTGMGIPTDKLEMIFDPFVQVDANYTRSQDGVGLGLAISRDLARGMEGELSVESVPGEGSIFTLTLPRVI